jgi:hypothetical protein
VLVEEPAPSADSREGPTLATLLPRKALPEVRSNWTKRATEAGFILGFLLPIVMFLSDRHFDWGFVLLGPPAVGLLGGATFGSIALLAEFILRSRRPRSVRLPSHEHLSRTDALPLSSPTAAPQTITTETGTPTSETTDIQEREGIQP